MTSVPMPRRYSTNWCVRCATTRPGGSNYRAIRIAGVATRITRHYRNAGRNRRWITSYQGASRVAGWRPKATGRPNWSTAVLTGSHARVTSTKLTGGRRLPCWHTKRPYYPMNAVEKISDVILMDDYPIVQLGLKELISDWKPCHIIRCVNFAETKDTILSSMHPAKLLVVGMHCDQVFDIEQLATVARERWRTHRLP